VFLLISWIIPLFGQNGVDSLKVLTFNVYGAPNSDWPSRLTMILDELEAVQPDIICLQEIVETPGLQGIDNRAKILADSLFERTGEGFNYEWQRTHFSWNTFDEGIAILSPHIILESDFVDLPAGLFPRKCLWTKVLTPAGIVNAFNTHLSFGAQENTRIDQVNSLKPFVQSKSAAHTAAATVVCGDFNAVPDSPPILLLTQTDGTGIRYHDSWNEANPSDPGPTVPSNAPDARIDYVFLKNDSQTEIIGSEQAFDTAGPNNLFPSDHIGVMSTFDTGIYSLDISIDTPGSGEEVAGVTDISWGITNQTEDLTYIVHVSSNNGATWEPLWEGESSSRTTPWNTLTTPDGANYLLNLAALDDSSFGLIRSEEPFIVNNPGNAPPELKLKAPKGGEHIDNDFTIIWTAKDADSDSLAITIEYSYNEGRTWHTIADNTQNTGSFIWNTTQVPNSSNYSLKLTGSDGAVSTSVVSRVFTISNERNDIPDRYVVHVSGNGAGTVTGKVYNPDLLMDHTYRLTFHDSIPSIKTYSVFDVTDQAYVLENVSAELDGITEGPPFDGIRLIIHDLESAVKDEANSGWRSGNSNLEYMVSLPSINTGSNVLYGYAYPADYLLTVADQIVDTSSTFLGASAVPMRFHVKNLTDGHPVDIIFLDSDVDQTVSPLDEVFILEKDIAGDPLLTWQIFFKNMSSPILPEAGDEFILTTMKPFSSTDIFEIKGSITGISREIHNGPLVFSLNQNYPNPFNSQTIIPFTIPEASRTELLIYNVRGQLVHTHTDHDLPAGHYSIPWDATQFVAGIYFYKLRSGSYISVKKAILLH